MDTQRLKKLVHKLVQINNETDHLKGFLFKNYNGDFYIKPIEVYRGDAKEAGKFLVTEENAEGVVFCESPKLMRVSMKSWHYKLMRWVLKGNTPTPKTMQNGCPYFWLLMFSLFASPFVFLGRTFVEFLMGFPYVFWKITEGLALLALRAIPEEKAYDIDYNGYSGNYKVPILAKTHFKHSGDRFMPLFIRAKYGIKPGTDEYTAKVAELKAIRDAWDEKRKIAREEREERDRIARQKAYEREREQERRNRIRRQKREKFWRPFNKVTDKMMNGVEKAMNFNYKTSTIIKRTKSFIGFLISVAVLAFAAVCVWLVGGLLIVIWDGLVFAITNWWLYILYGLGAIAAIFLIILIGRILLNWAQTVIANYKIGKKVWYVQGLLWMTVFPIKYIILGIFWLFYYVLFVPLKWLFYTVLWQSILTNVGIFLWGILKAFGGILIGSIGIFGEYFGADKKGYCPGLEWTDVPEEYQ